MLSLSKTKIENVIPIFSNKGVDVAFLVPTDTGIAKSIMDATTPVRQFLLRNGIHDYGTQKQGPDYKVLFPAFFVAAEGLIETAASLYRPLTKTGDPRIWFRMLKQYCSPRDLLGIVTDGEALFVFNLSSASVIKALQRDSAAAKVLSGISAAASTISAELLEKLRIIHKMGFVNTVIRGDTGIGMTLEHLLNITPNTDKTPDYKGIELKATRKKPSGQQNRVSLFSQVPNWEKSKMSAWEILNTFGYIEQGRRQLYCTVSAARPNPQGLYFVVDEKTDILYNKSKLPGTAAAVDVAVWEIDRLRARLNEKHKETFWIKAVSRTENGIEQFRFDSVVHTRRPNSHLLGALLEQSIITMDYTLSHQGNRVRDHGYLFKIKPDNVGLLFPNPVYYDLKI